MEKHNLTHLRGCSDWEAFLSDDDPLNVELGTGSDSGFIGEYIVGFLILDLKMSAFGFPPHPSLQRVPATHSYVFKGVMDSIDNTLDSWATFIPDFICDHAKRPQNDSHHIANHGLTPLVTDTSLVASGSGARIHNTRQVFELAKNYAKISHSTHVLSNMYTVAFIIMVFDPVSWFSFI
jgi:hypothetical protein